MRRSILLTLSALGLVVTLVGGTGLFAALVDTADTGENEITTDGLAGSADLQLAFFGPDISDPDPNAPHVCGEYSENLTSGLFTVNPAALPSTVAGTLCVRNVGAQTVTLDVRAIDLEDRDPECTGDEVEYGDLDCGTVGAQDGELAGIVSIQLQPTDCVGGLTGPLFGGVLSNLVQQPLGLLPDLGSDAVTCYAIEAFVGTGYSTAEQQVAQSDSVTWKFRFTGTTVQ